MIRRKQDRSPSGCPSAGALRASLDGEAAEATAAHVRECAICAARLEELRSAAGWTKDALQRAYAPADARSAWPALGRRLYLSEEGSLMETKPALWNRGAFRLATAFAAILAVVAVFSLTPMRTVADGMLDRFRVEKFAVVTIPMDLVSPFQSAFLENLDDADSAAWKERFDALGSFTTTFNMTSARYVDSADAARESYGDFAVPDESALPDGFASGPMFYVSDPGSATYVLNTAEAQGIIDQLGLPIYSLPDAAAYPTLTFDLQVPAAVGMLYASDNGEQLLVAQMESPTLDIPEGLDMNALREEILQFPGLPTDLVAQLRAIDDWEHTLIIPIPEGADSSDVTVNGEPGLLIEDPEKGSAVLWQDGGVLHLVAGQVDGDAVLDVANSLD